jgi:phosphohistidine phosphatase
MTDVLLIRHAIAEDRARAREAGIPDADRALTRTGKQRMTAAAEGLRRLVGHLSVVGTSPLRRAVQTARIVAAAFDDAPVIEVPALAPGGSVLDVAAWIARQEHGAVALVGHEPDMGLWTGWALAGASRPVVRFRKGGVCCLRFDGVPEAGAAMLQWSLAPAHLRRIGA